MLIDGAEKLFQEKTPGKAILQAGVDKHEAGERKALQPVLACCPAVKGGGGLAANAAQTFKPCLF